MADIQPVVHPAAHVDPRARLGAGVRVGPGTVIGPDVTLGDEVEVGAHAVLDGRVAVGARCRIGQNVFIASDVTLGENVKVQNNVNIYNGVTCEDDVFLGPNMTFTNVRNPRSAVVRRDEYLRTHVQKGATIGAQATITRNIGTVLTTTSAIEQLDLAVRGGTDQLSLGDLAGTAVRRVNYDLGTDATIGRDACSPASSSCQPP